MKKFLKIGLFNLLALLLLLLLMEGMLRLLGFQPYQPRPALAQVSPAPYGCAHPRWGFALRPGTYRFSLPGSLSFTATHQADSLRMLTRQKPVDTPLQEIHLYGCSLTYGYGVDDSATFAWRLQQAFPQTRFANQGVSGYSLSQMWVRMQDRYARGDRPDLILLGYASFHDERNPVLRHWKKSLQLRESDFGGKGEASRVPAHRLRRKKLFFQPQSLSYRPWPLMEQSALVHALEVAWNELEFSLIKTRAISGGLLLRISQWCQERNIGLLVLGLDDNPYTRKSMQVCEIFDISHLPLHLPAAQASYFLLPWDPHPSPEGHAWYAQRIATFLREKGLVKK
jgi:hypothetical protein